MTRPSAVFIFPSLVDRSPIIIAISSGGKAPVLARMLREKIETLVPQHIGKMAAMAGAFRDTLKARIPTLAGRRKFWEAAFSGRFADLVAAGKHPQAEQALEQLSGQITTQGEVALIGAGPGDPGLLTLRALQLMQQADVVFYDYLVAEPIMELCRRDAELFCVGKRANYHSVSQGDINRLLVEHAQAGQRVVRLKGGDLSCSAVVARSCKRWQTRVSRFKWCLGSLLPQEPLRMPVFRSLTEITRKPRFLLPGI